MPTDAELQILTVLWRTGDSTVREVQEQLDPAATGYTTVLKLLQIMLEKGLVERDESDRAHVYRARPSEDQVQSSLVESLLGRAFEGSTSRLVMSALSTKRATRRELSEIRSLLDQLEQESTK